MLVDVVFWVPTGIVGLDKSYETLCCIYVWPYVVIGSPSVLLVEVVCC